MDSNNKEILHAKWLSGEISDEEIISQLGVNSLDELHKIVNAIDTWEMPAYNTESGYEKFKNKQSRKTIPTSKIRWIRLSSIAASFLLLIFAYTQYTKKVTIYSSYAETKTHMFGDGTKVMLNDGSSITYTERTWDNNRHLDLVGEAFFEVEKGSPFIVNTSNGTVLVLGTKFNVRAWDDKLRVECYEGKVKVQVQKETVILQKGEQVSAIHNSLQAKQISTKKRPDWQIGQSRFFNENLRAVCDELERQYNTVISLSNEEKTFSGTFVHDNLRAALESVCKPLGLSFEINTEKNSVVIE